MKRSEPERTGANPSDAEHARARGARRPRPRPSIGPFARERDGALGARRGRRVRGTRGKAFPSRPPRSPAAKPNDPHDPILFNADGTPKAVTSSITPTGGWMKSSIYKQ